VIRPGGAARPGGPGLGHLAFAVVLEVGAEGEGGLGIVAVVTGPVLTMDRTPSAVLAGIPAGRASPYVSQLCAQLTPWGILALTTAGQQVALLIGDMRTISSNTRPAWCRHPPRDATVRCNA
jgi:hypothetical protein